MMYAQKEARSARQFRAVAILATIVFHLALFAAVGSGMFGAKDKEDSSQVSVKQEAVVEKGKTNLARP